MLYSLADLLVAKRFCKGIETAILEASQLSGPSSSHKYYLSNLFEVIFNRKSEHCRKLRINNPDAVKRKLTRMIALGKDNLQVRKLLEVNVAPQVISDFDWTMSKFVHKGERTPSCHGIFEQAPDMSLEIQNQLRILQKTYEQVECDPTIPVSTKIPLMVEWWDLAQKAIVKSNVHKYTLKATVNQCNLALRDYVGDFIVQLHRENIPMLIFSAGIGNVIELLLERFHLRFDNVRVVSNFMDFNAEVLLLLLLDICRSICPPSTS
ncbi:unnamed protein product [Dibothriocephalus latus]|uniref:5'-nucleotidase n=1 Tax=Dibothriocephalus latus TaxID=60516 RepID=A0A3P7LIM1_DIBLA|nr:unnamed protein product [Dibothriocephalus latus]